MDDEFDRIHIQDLEENRVEWYREFHEVLLRVYK